MMDWLKIWVGLLIVIKCYMASIEDPNDCFLICSHQNRNFTNTPSSYMCLMSEYYLLNNGTNVTYDNFVAKKCVNLTLDVLKKAAFGVMNGSVLTFWPPDTLISIFDTNNEVLLSSDISHIDVNFMNDEKIRHLSSLGIFFAQNLSELKPYTFNGSSIDKLYLGKNSINTVDGAFLGSENIQLLSLISNKLQKITNSSFLGLPDLRTLLLRNNKIFFIESGSFTHLPNLEILELRNNLLTQVDDSIFSSNQKLTTLDLDFNKLKKISFSITNDNLIKLHLSDNEIEHLNSSSFQGLTNLRYLELLGNPLKQINSDAFTFSTVLEFIYIACPNDTATTIAEKTFLTSSYVMQIVINRCLVELPPNGFNGIYVDYLVLNGTQILNISQATFNGIYYIGYLQISHGILENIETLAFKDFQFTLTIDLTHNKISTIEAWFDFVYDYHIQTLDLSHNKIEHIETNAFQGLSRLQDLILESNRIKTISEETMIEIPLIRYIFLDNNEIEHLMDIGLPTSHGQHLKILSLSYNLMTEITFKAEKPLYVDDLFLDHNNLETLNCKQFQNLFMEALWSNWNKIKSLNFRCQHGSSLKYLDVSHNKIKEITALQLEDFGIGRLELLNLSHNQLEHFVFLDTLLTDYIDMLVDLSFNQAKFLSANPLLEKAEKVFFQGNPWECSCDDKHFFMNHFLPKYDFGIPCCPENCICGWSLKNEMIVFCEGTLQYKLSDCNPYNNTVLKYANASLLSISNVYDFQHVLRLNVSRNYLTSNKFALGSSAIDLKMIDLSYNEFSLIDESTAKMLTHIENVQLHGNPWECSCDSNHTTIMNLLLDKIINLPCCPPNCSCFNQELTFVVNCSGVIGAGLSLCLPYDKVYLDYSYSSFHESFSNLNYFNLMGVDLSHNEMVSFSLDTFQNKMGLQSIDLSNNRIKTISMTTAKVLEKIPRKELSNNPWTCSCKTKDSLLMQILLENSFSPPCCPNQCHCTYDSTNSYVHCQGTDKPKLPSCVPWKNSHINLSNTSLSLINFNNATSMKNVVGIDLSHLNDIHLLDNLNQNIFPNLRYLNLEYNNLKNLSKLKTVKHLDLYLEGNLFDCRSCTELSEYTHIENITCINGAFKKKEFDCFVTNVVVPSVLGTLVFVIGLVGFFISLQNFLRKRIDPNSSNGVTIQKVKKADIQYYRKSVMCYQKIEQSLESFPPNVLRRIWSNKNGYIIYEKWQCTLKQLLERKTNFDKHTLVIEMGSVSVLLNQIFKNILEGLSQIHSINIIHGGINLDSFFLVQDTESFLKVKLGSFASWSHGQEGNLEKEKAEDVYQAGKIMENVMQELECKDPLLQNLIAAMTQQEWNKRPSCAKTLLDAPGFFPIDKMIDVICDVNEQLLTETEKMQKNPKDHLEKQESDLLFKTLETHATFVFGGHTNWLQLLNFQLCLEFCCHGKYKISSILFLNRLIRNVINHKGNNPKSLEKVLGKVNPSREDVFGYFHSIFPMHFLHIFAFWKLNLLKEENMFAMMYLDYEKQCYDVMDVHLQMQNHVFVQIDDSRRELFIINQDPLTPLACLTYQLVKRSISEQLSVNDFLLNCIQNDNSSEILNPNSVIMDGSLIVIEKIEIINITVCIKSLPQIDYLTISLKNNAKISKLVNQVFLSLPPMLQNNLKKENMLIFLIEQCDRKEMDKKKKLSDYKIHDNSLVEVEFRI